MKNEKAFHSLAFIHGKFISLFVLFFLYTLKSTCLFAQQQLIPGIEYQRRLMINEIDNFTFSLKKGEASEFTLMQKGSDLVIDVLDPAGKKMKTFDSPNGDFGPELVFIDALKTGNYSIHIYSYTENNPLTDSSDANSIKINQADYTIQDIRKLTTDQNKERKSNALKDKMQFANWINTNAQPINSVDAGSTTDDLQIFKAILKDVRIVGLGEATHGSSVFFRMKHRMLEFLVKEMGFTSFYIEASMSRCTYINDYVLYGRGNPDTATAIQGFWTWRTDEVRDMIVWMRQYNSTVPDENKVQFWGYDLQINDGGWKELKLFYSNVNPSRIAQLDSLQTQFDSASIWSNTADRQLKGAELFKEIHQKCLNVLNDIALNEGQYEYIAGKVLYDANLMNIKLIVQEAESYMDDYNDRRDYYMAQNILYLLNKEKPGVKVVAWAHNGHIGKDASTTSITMGSYLDNVLKSKYYAIGFEFHSGSFQTMNLDSIIKSKNPAVMSVAEPPLESLPWYFNNTGKDKLFLDFRNTGSEKITNFLKPIGMHSFGSMYSRKWPETFQMQPAMYDGMIYIKESTAAKNFTKVVL